VASVSYPRKTGRARSCDWRVRIERDFRFDDNAARFSSSSTQAVVVIAVVVVVVDHVCAHVEDRGAALACLT
jgi:hypothetical protein